MNTANRARIARKRAQRLGLQLTQRGTVFTLKDDDITLSLGPLGVVDAYLIERIKPQPPGPARSTRAPEAWRRDVQDYLLTLSAAGQREATVRLRFQILCMVARGLGCPPAQVTAEKLIDWLGRQQHLSPEGRKSYGCTLRGFFSCMYSCGRIKAYLGDALPRVRVPKAAARPTNDDAWDAALAGADARTELMLRLAAQCGLRRAEVAQVHSSHIDRDTGQILVHGKGGKQRTIPISDHLAHLIPQRRRRLAVPQRHRRPPDGGSCRQVDRPCAAGRLDCTTPCDTDTPPGPTAEAATCEPSSSYLATNQFSPPSGTPRSTTTKSEQQPPTRGDFSRRTELRSSLMGARRAGSTNHAHRPSYLRRHRSIHTRSRLHHPAGRAGRPDLATVRAPRRLPMPPTAARLRARKRDAMLRSTRRPQRSMRLQPRDLRMDHTRRHLIWTTPPRGRPPRPAAQVDAGQATTAASSSISSAL